MKPLLRDPNGHIIPAGKVHRRLVEPFLGATALPSWLETPNPTDVTLVGGAASHGYCQISSVSNAVRTVQVGFDINTTHLREVRWTFEGLHLSHDTDLLLAVGLTGTGTGINLVHNSAAADGLPYLRILNAGGNVDVSGVPYRFIGNLEAAKRRNVSLMLRPQSGVAYLLTGDDVIAHFDVSASLTNGVIRPKVAVQAFTASARWVRFSQVALDVVHN